MTWNGRHETPTGRNRTIALTPAGCAAAGGHTIGCIGCGARVPDDARPADVLAAAARVRAWLTDEVHDWYDPVINPDLHDDLRLVMGLPPEDRSAGV